MSKLLTTKIIHLASDHAGFEAKSEILAWLKESGHEVVDQGATIYDADDDFPDFIELAAKAVSTNSDNSVGIIFGGSGQGEAMIANRFSSVRATVFYGGDLEIIRLSRIHNNANILSFGCRFISLDEIKEAITLWLATETSEEQKYARRNNKIEKITKEIYSLWNQ